MHHIAPISFGHGILLCVPIWFSSLHLLARDLSCQRDSQSTNSRSTAIARVDEPPIEIQYRIHCFTWSPHLIEPISHLRQALQQKHLTAALEYKVSSHLRLAEDDKVSVIDAYSDIERYDGKLARRIWWRASHRCSDCRVKQMTSLFVELDFVAMRLHAPNPAYFWQL